jgi:hypothetical protein
VSAPEIEPPRQHALRRRRIAHEADPLGASALELMRERLRSL